MRGSSDPQLAMFTSVSAKDLIPADHPIRKIRVVVDPVLAELDDTFDAMYSSGGRRSVPPEVLLKSTVLMAMYSIRSERAFCERLNYDSLFKWFLDMRIDQPACEGRADPDVVVRLPTVRSVTSADGWIAGDVTPSLERVGRVVAVFRNDGEILGAGAIVATYVGRERWAQSQRPPDRLS